MYMHRMLVTTALASAVGGCSAGANLPSLATTELSAERAAFISGASAIARAYRDSIYAGYVSELRSTGRTTVSVSIATRRPTTPSMASLVSALTAIGGTAEFREDAIGYIRVRLPVRVVERLRSFPEIAEYAIHGAPRWSGPPEASSPRSDGTPQLLQRPEPAVNPSMLAVDAFARPSPYIPLDEIGIDRLRRRVPAADGRGVTIGIVDGGSSDYTHPALQTALTLTGDTISKIAGMLDTDWLVSTTMDHGDLPTHRRHRSALVRDTAITTRDGSALLEDQELQLPTPGTWYVGTWLRTDPYGDDALHVPFLVAWQDTTEAWVDLNRDGDFLDEVAISNINVRFSAGTLPADSAAGYPRAYPFVVAFDLMHRPRLYAEDGNSHRTMVSGAAAGAGPLGGLGDGVAPGARILPVMVGSGPARVVEALLVAARDERIDIITAQKGPRPLFPYTGAGLVGLLIERIATRYRKPIFMSAGNGGPWMGSIYDVAAAPSVVTVGAYVSRRSIRVNEGLETSAGGNLARYSSRGPLPNGSWKPDVVAPALLVTSASCSHPPATSPIMYALPPCYMLAGGTSTAAPVAAGVAAVLTSAARLRGLPPVFTEARMMQWALRGSARSLPSVRPYEQGFGLIQADSAWRLLESTWSAGRRASARENSLNVPLYHIVARAPVENSFSPYLEGSSGPGMYLREGWRAGRRGTRAITLWRLSGPRLPVRYELKLRGGNGTFRVRTSTVSLALQKPVRVEVMVAPENDSVHAAALDLVDPVSATTMHRIPLMVVSAPLLTARNDFTMEWTDELTESRYGPMLLQVPRGMRVLQFTLHGAHACDPRLVLRWPFAGARISSPQLLQPDSTGAGIMRVQNPAPGTWALHLTSNMYWDTAGEPQQGCDSSFKLTVSGTPG